MLSRLFLWFYCLPIPQAILVTGGLTGLLFLLHRRLGRHRWWTLLLAAVFLGGCFAIACQTVLLRTPGAAQAPELRPFASYLEVLRGGNSELLRSSFMNVVLFYPLGLCASLIVLRRHPVLRLILISAVLFSFSCDIEAAQLHWNLGLCEADDVLHNTLGAFLGALIGGEYPRIFPEE